MSKKLSLVVLLAGFLLFSSWALASRTDEKPQLPDRSDIQECAHECIGVALVQGLGEFEFTLRGTLTAETGQRYNHNGLTAVPVTILGNTMRDYVDGLGEMVLWLDKGRPTTGSFLREQKAGGAFPATQEMNNHFLLTVEAFPGRTFRTIEPFAVHSDEVKSFPPQGANFRLSGPVEFEDVDEPGAVVITLTRGSAVVGGK